MLTVNGNSEGKFKLGHELTLISTEAVVRNIESRCLGLEVLRMSYFLIVGICTYK